MSNLKLAECFLKSHYQEDCLDADRIRRDVEHWERVASDARRFPNADLDFIDRFSDAAYAYLGGMSHRFEVESSGFTGPVFNERYGFRDMGAEERAALYGTDPIDERNADQDECARFHL